MNLKKLLFIFLVMPVLVNCGDSTPESENILVSIEIDSTNTVTSYFEGDTIIPEGLIINCIGTLFDEKIEYDKQPEDFTFNPSLSTPLTVENKLVEVSYKGKSNTYTINVFKKAENTFTANFTERHDQVDDLPSTGNTGNARFPNILNNYYITDSNLTISTFSGEYAQITGDKKGFQVTETRNYPQVLILGGQKQVADITLVFETTIKSVEFVCEAYSKYVEYNSTYNVDYSTSLTINNIKKEIGTHQSSDVNETKSLEYIINSNTIHIEVPNDNSGASSDKKGNRIIVYEMIFNY